MAKKKRTSHKSKKIPVLATAGVAIFALNAIREYQANGPNGLAWAALGTEANGKFHTDKFLMNVAPIIVGVGGSMIASKTRMNRHLSAIPMFKL